MKPSSIILLLVSAMVASCNETIAQTDSSYLIYQKQFRELTLTRSGTESEAGKALEKFNKNQIISNESFATFLQKIYPSNKGIGVLLFFFHHDTLRRLFFEPGRIVDEQRIPITARALQKLYDNLQLALNVTDEAAKRSPVLRGITLPEHHDAAINLDTSIAQLTRLLLPAAFTTSYQHLVIIPSLNIGAFPFHLLRPYNDGSYLIDHCSFTIAPTLVDFVGLRYEVLFNAKAQGFDPTMSPLSFDEMRQHNFLLDTDSVFFSLNNALFIANPAYPAAGHYYYPNLPGAEQEVASAIPYAERYTLLKGKEATKDSVLYYMNGRDVVYFATHGVSSATHPDDSSFLVLSGTDPYLTSLEIKDLRFRKDYTVPELVILSACQTGLGASMEAGIMGSLARAFLLAGSNHVIMSLWSVDDAATAYLMNRFIFHLRQPALHSPATPLRQAILDTKKRYPNPRYWACFSLIGVEY